MMKIESILDVLFSLISTKLRARQKERLARRNAGEESCPTPTEQLPHESAPHCPLNNAEDCGEQASGPVQSAAEKSLIIDLEDKQYDAPKRKSDSPLRLGRLSKNKISSHLDRSVNPLDHSSPDMFLPSHQLMGTNYTNSSFTSNLLPVLGLCAPNASQIESSHKKFSRSNGRQSRPGPGPEFPFSLAPQLGNLSETDINVETLANRMKLCDASPDFLQQHLKSGISDGRLPLSLVFSCSLFETSKFLLYNLLIYT